MSDAAQTNDALAWFYSVVEERSYSNGIAWTAARVLTKTIHTSSQHGQTTPWETLDLGWRHRLQDFTPSQRSRHPFSVACLRIAFKMHSRNYAEDIYLTRSVLFTIPWDAVTIAEKQILATIEFGVYFTCPFFMIAELAKSQGLRIDAVEHAGKCITSLSMSNALHEPVDPVCVAIASILHFERTQTADDKKLVFDAHVFAACMERWGCKIQGCSIEHVMQMFATLCGLSAIGVDPIQSKDTKPAKRPIPTAPSTNTTLHPYRTRVQTRSGAVSTKKAKTAEPSAR